MEWTKNWRVDEELAGQVGLCLVVLGYQEGTGGVLVYAVHQDAHAVVLGVRALAASQIPGKAVDEGARVVAAAGMDYQTCRLVHYQDILVLIPYVQVHLLGQYLIAAAAVGKADADVVQGLDPVVGLDRGAADVDVSRVYGLLDAVA